MQPSSTNDVRPRGVMETAVDGVILIDAAGTVLMFNPACERLFGYAADEVIGRNFKVLLKHESNHNGHDRPFNYHGHEVTGRRRDGSTFSMDLSLTEAKHQGESVWVGVICDLTERKTTERVLREDAARLSAIVETAVDGVILIDSAGIVQMFNPACERLYGYAADEIIGRNVKTLMLSPFNEEHDLYLSNYRQAGEGKIIGISREVVGRRRDGSPFPMDLSVGEAKQEGESIFVGIIHDLTERKRTQEQLVQAKKMEMLGQLSGGIAHDFNNLLTVIIGNADLLGERLTPRPDLKHFCDTIMSAGERGAELTRRLVAFSRRQDLQPALIDANQLVQGMKILLRRTLPENIEIRTSLDPHLAPALADPAQLESAILNLALNAQDAMPNGGTLTMSTSIALLDQRYQDDHPEVTPGTYVLISITDDGLGMTHETTQRVFEPFFTTKGVGKGSGLGLSMVYGFIKQSSGHVAIYSEALLGTTVKLYLPIVHSDASLEAEGKESEGDAPRGFETVLVVEDDAYVRGYVVGCLESLGYKIITATDGHDGLEKLRKHAATIDVVFSDVVMPGSMSGWDLAQRAQEQKPGLKVLLTSGYALETTRSDSRPNVKMVILNKPYRKSELGRRLREILDS